MPLSSESSLPAPVPDFCLVVVEADTLAVADCRPATVPPSLHWRHLTDLPDGRRPNLMPEAYNPTPASTHQLRPELPAVVGEPAVDLELPGHPLLRSRSDANPETTPPSRSLLSATDVSVSARQHCRRPTLLTSSPATPRRATGRNLDAVTVGTPFAAVALVGIPLCVRNLIAEGVESLNLHSPSYRSLGSDRRSPPLPPQSSPATAPPMPSRSLVLA